MTSREFSCSRKALRLLAIMYERAGNEVPLDYSEYYKREETVSLGSIIEARKMLGEMAHGGVRGKIALGLAGASGTLYESLISHRVRI